MNDGSRGLGWSLVPLLFDFTYYLNILCKISRYYTMHSQTICANNKNKINQTFVLK